jgi:hypothetical protein
VGSAWHDLCNVDLGYEIVRVFGGFTVVTLISNSMQSKSIE